jgi:hypothetical protein
MTVCRDFFWFREFGAFAPGDSAMATERKFREQRAYERRLVEDGTLRRRAWGLVVIGAGCLLMGLVSHDAFTLTVGVFALGAGGIWRWCLN